MGPYVLGLASMDEHSQWKSFVDAEGHGFSATHQRYNRCSSLMGKTIAICMAAQDMWNFVLFSANHIRHELGRQIPSNTMMGSPQRWAGKICITNRCHEQLGRIPVFCMQN